MPKRHESPPLAPRFRIFAISFGVFTVILIAVIIFFSSSEATVFVVPKKELVSVDFPLRVESSQAGKEMPSGSVSGVVIQKELNREEQFEATGTKESESRATGKLTVINTSSFSQPLVATTRFLTPEGMLFRLKQGIVVGADDKIEAEVYADKPGPDGDIGSSKFTIPGLNPAKQKLIFGESASPMTGGKKIVRIVSSEDILKGKMLALENIEKETKEDLSRKYPELKEVVISRDVISSEVSAKTGDETQGFTINLKARINAVAYDGDMVKRTAFDKLALAVSEDKELISFNDKALLVRLVSFDSDKGIASFRVYADGNSVIKLSSPILAKEKLAGMTREQVKEYFESFDSIERVEVKLTPNWLKKIPTLKDHIDVVIQK